MFDQMRMRKQMEINARSGIRPTVITTNIDPAAQFKSAPLSELMTKAQPLPTEVTKKITTKKKKFQIPDTKDEIVDAIIEDKPSITDVKKALKEYVRISQEEFIDN
jgi:hypothetical protein